MAMMLETGRCRADGLTGRWPGGKGRFFLKLILLGCPGTEVRMNGERINGLVITYLQMGYIDVYWGTQPIY